MKKSIARFVLLGGIFLLSCPAVLSQREESAPDREVTIIHTVMFSLKSAPDSQVTAEFLRDGKRILTSIPGVLNFEVRRQVSRKNPYQFGFSMHFADREAFEEYLNHPLHQEFVRERWDKEVSGFLEADYTAIPLD